MKIAMSSYTGMGAWFVLRLMAEGHKVDYYLSEAKYEDVLSGLIPAPRVMDIDHRRRVQGYGYPSYKGYDLSLFDLTGRAKQADASKEQAPTIGDGSFEHWLEDDREAGIQAMESCEINVPPYTRFNTPTEAKAFIRKNDRRYVFKPFTQGGTTQDTATTYVSKSASDLIEYIDTLWDAAKHAPFILQEFIKGEEIGIEGFFNGEDFYMLTGTLEEKKFLNDNKGPNTGCSGNLIFALSSESKIYQDGLKKCIPMLKAANFRGILDLNSIIAGDKLYALEWTPRFGYLCCPTIATMYGARYPELLLSIASGKVPEIKWEALFGSSVTLSIPPYPTEIRLPKAKDVPIEGLDPEDINQLTSTYMFDVMLSKNKKKLITSGNYGYICAPIGVGDSIQESAACCDKAIDRIQIPNMQYRTDIHKSTLKRHQFLETNSWL
jgi:phosphoribosylamine-glycine ligase